MCWQPERSQSGRAVLPPARRAQLCEVAPIVPHGGSLASSAGAPPLAWKGGLFISFPAVSCVKASRTKLRGVFFLIRA